MDLGVPPEFANVRMKFRNLGLTAFHSDGLSHI